MTKTRLLLIFNNITIVTKIFLYCMVVLLATIGFIFGSNQLEKLDTMFNFFGFLGSMALALIAFVLILIFMLCLLMLIPSLILNILGFRRLFNHKDTRAAKIMLYIGNMLCALESITWIILTIISFGGGIGFIYIIILLISILTFILGLCSIISVIKYKPE